MMDGSQSLCERENEGEKIKGELQIGTLIKSNNTERFCFLKF